MEEINSVDNRVIFLDCTLRDGGYYNNWNFEKELIDNYLDSMQSAGVNVVEIGLRSFKNEGFKGACAFVTDSFIRTLNIPSQIIIGVMVNAAELLDKNLALETLLSKLFPESAEHSPVKLVRIACHIHEFVDALPASLWLKDKGFLVGFNLMQIADRSEQEVVALAENAARYPIDVLYFADSMGSMDPQHCAQIIGWLRKGWSGAIGIHTHDNMGLALQNTLQALKSGVKWLDSTVTGMGRGPGNARTEELAIELATLRAQTINMIPLMRLIRHHFKPMQQHYGWGTNPYYYLAGKYGIHPSYIQEMQGDSRYDEEDILAVIEHLRLTGGKKFSLNNLDGARHFYRGDPKGNWNPVSMLKDKDVLLLGTGPGIVAHRDALENFISKNKPIVIALNTQTAINSDLINLRVACHPVRLLADYQLHTQLPQPLITPFSMLPQDVKIALKDKQIYDFGLAVTEEKFLFHESFCILPTSLVVAYALAIAASGKAKTVLMAGFDGYAADDPRNREMDGLIKQYESTPDACKLFSITPTRYHMNKISVYGI